MYRQTVGPPRCDRGAGTTEGLGHRKDSIHRDRECRRRNGSRLRSSLPIQSDRETWLADVAATPARGCGCYRQDRWRIDNPMRNPAVFRAAHRTAPTRRGRGRRPAVLAAALTTVALVAGACGGGD